MSNLNGFLARVLLAILLVAGGAHTAAEVQRETPVQSPPQRVLFVGNSLTYYGNLPAVFSALAKANGTFVVSEMLVAPGARLAQRLSDGSVARALEEKDYTALVLQEQGGALAGFFGSDVLYQSRHAVKTLVAIARKRGLQVVLMGTYQAHPDVSRRLIEAESSAAAEARIPYIEVSAKLRRLTRTAPQLTWFADDGQHPGKHLALLNAILVHEAVLGSLPGASALDVEAPIYGGNTGLDGALRPADAPPPRADTPGQVHYSSETLTTILRTLQR